MNKRNIQRIRTLPNPLYIIYNYSDFGYTRLTNVNMLHMTYLVFMTARLGVFGQICVTIGLYALGKGKCFENFNWNDFGINLQ